MRSVALVICVPAIVFLTACSSGPVAPQKGTPAFYWAAAKQTFAAGDYLKTSDNLDKILKSENEFKATALPWSLILTSGMAHGYMELGDSFEQGARANKANPAMFRRQTGDDRRAARALALQFAEKFQDFVKNNHDEQIRLAFPFPNGTTAGIPLLTKAGSGIVPSSQEIEDGVRSALQRAIIIETSRAVGAGEDATKARQQFAGGEVKIPRMDFLLTMAVSLHDQAMLFGPTKMDEPEKMKMMSAQALAALKGMPDSKPVKDLSTRIDKAMKAPRPRTM